jgi:PAS domain S-box-containing protein
MEKDQLNIQILLEIALNQKVFGDVEASLDEVINLYIRKINCFAAAVFQKSSIQRIYPEALTNNSNWNKKIEEISSRLKDQESVPFHFFDEDSNWFVFPLFHYGWLALIRKNELSQEMFLELSKVVLQLGKDMCQSQEEQRMKLLQDLFDHSSDAIQISEENGKLYYINKVASKRLGIQLSDAHNYEVSDFELRFKDKRNWFQHIKELENHGKMILEGQNVNLETGQLIDVEVTVNLLEAKGKRFVIANSRDITQRKIQEETLRSTKQMLESIFNEMTDVIWSVKLPEYQLIFVTPSVEALFEVKTEVLFQDKIWWEKYVIPEDLDTLDHVKSQLETKGSYYVKFRIQTTSGKTKWIRNKGKYIFDSDNNPIRLDGVIMDRTIQYTAQENLDQELKLQETLIDIASTYINLDPKDLISTINKSLEKMGLFVSADRAYIFDYNFENGTTSNTFEWCNEGIDPEIENLQQVPIDFFPQWVEKHRNNEAFYVPDVNDLEQNENGGLREILEPQGIKSLIAIPMLDRDDLIGFVGFDSVRHHYHYSDKEKKLLFLFGQMLINIRNRQKWENQLRFQEEKYRNIIANMNLGLLELDLNDNIIYANQSFVDMSGHLLSELKGKKASELFGTKEYSQFYLDQKGNSNFEITDSYEVKIRNKNGHSKWWFVSSAPHYNDKHQLIGSIGVHVDITEQKQLETELAKAKNFAEAAAKAKELFLANMSHEIRTPLNVIIGMIRQLTKEDLTQQQHFYVKQSESSARHLLTILNNILDIAKIESGDLEIFQVDFSPSALVHNVHSILYSQAIEKNLAFNLLVSNQIKEVLLGDETRLRQVLINLIGNAIKFTEVGSVDLTLSVLKDTPTSQTVRFEVRDTGIGMSDEFIALVFDKFSQEQNAANRKYEGTGLGMAISNDLVKLMNSQLVIDSRKNLGTRIYFDLCLPLGSRNNILPKSNKVLQNSFTGLKALLVEDNEMNRLIALQSLDFLGFNTSEAENGLKAIEMVQSQNFDLILMDIQMPVMDGVEATIIIRDELKIKTPIVALTANAFKHDIDLYLQKGMNDFITKPYDENDFFRKIEKVITYNNQLLDLKDFEFPGKLTLAEEKLYDLSMIEKMSYGDKEFIKKIIGIFISQSIENSNLILRSLEENNYDTISAIAHKLKPSIEHMGISSLYETVRKVEKFDPNITTLDEFKQWIDHLTSTLLKVAEQLKAI